jgi:hypothetical protein
VFAAGLEAFLSLFINAVRIRQIIVTVLVLLNIGILKFMLICIDLKEVKYLCYAGFIVIAIDFCFYLISLFSNTIVFQNFFNLILLVVPANKVQ